MQRQRAFGLVSGLVQIAVLPHLAQHGVAAGQHLVVITHRVRARGLTRHGGKGCRLMRGKLGQRLVEIGQRRSGHPIAVLAEVNFVQIQFKNAVLGQRLNQTGGQDQFLDLALGRAVAGQKEVLGHLLRDRRGAAQPAAGHRILHGRGHAHHIKARVGVEVLVLGADEGVLHHIGDILNRHEQPTLFGKFVDHPAFAIIDAADDRRAVLRQALMAWQVARIHPEDAANSQRGEQQPQGHQCEDGPEE